jgi:hypothetical protein
VNINGKLILACCLIIALAILLSDGFYKFETIQGGVVHKYNVFTGSVELCLQNSGCRDFRLKSK